MAVIIKDQPIDAGVQTRYPDIRDSLGRTGIEVVNRAVQSDNFVTGSAGWQLTAEGDFEGNSGTFRGTITATVGTIGGWTINATSIYTGTEDHSGYTANAGDLTIYSDGVDASIHAKNFYIDAAGVLNAASAVISGTLTIGAGSSGIANLSDAGALAVLSVIGNAYITDLAVSKLSAGTISSKDIVLAIAAGTGDVAIRAGKTDFTNTESGFILGLDDSDSDRAKFYIGDATTYLNWTGTGLVISGSIAATAGSSIATSYLSGLIAQANLNVADRGWSQTSAFSVTDADTVAWGAGTFTSADGTAYSIGVGNTGNMAAKTYIYLDTAISTTAYQTTTTSTTAVGAGKVLIAIAQNGTGEATFQVLSGQGGLNIDAANIVALSITANEIAASTITSGKMSVSQLSAIAADMGAITAGTIVMPSGGLIRSGQTAYDVGTGFYLGNDVGTPRFSIGDAAANKITWDGTTLTVVGDVSSAVSFTAGESIAADDTVVAIANTYSLDLEDTSSQYASITDAAQTGLEMTTAFTIEFWCKPETLTAGAQTIVGKWKVGQRSYTVLTSETNKIRVIVSDDGSIAATHFVAWTTNAAALADGTWAHIAVTFDVATETAVIYVNGSSVAVTKDSGTSMGASIFNSEAAFAIGASFDNLGVAEQFYDGLLDEVRVWNVVRTATEILDNYQLPLAGAETGLKGYWTLDNNYEDETTNVNTLTATGSPVFSTTTNMVITRVFRASGLTTRLSRGFVGFARTTVTAGNSISVNLGPSVSLTSTIAGAGYYLSDTRGAIATSAGTVSRKIGIGLPSNKLTISNIW